MRGEEIRMPSAPARTKELPPHARRRDIRGALEAICTGITSACAEKRIVSSLDSIAGRNYLRMRGEESLKSRRFVDTWELPPHARRRDCVTCGKATRPGKHLRMREEEKERNTRLGDIRELPPHARRRGLQAAPITGVTGITSACAEKRLRYLRKL